MPRLTARQKDKLAENLQSVMAEAEALLEATADDASSGISELRNRMKDTLSQAKSGLEDAQSAVMDQCKAVAQTTDGYVHDHPWKAVSVAAGMGLVIGLLIARR